MSNDEFPNHSRVPDEDKRWRCGNERRGHIVRASEFLRAPNPFGAGDIIGCPVCRDITEWTEICDIAGCDRAATCGGVHKDGVYRRTCGPHAEWLHR